MKLMLDHTQRLNLYALLGAQRADVGSIRSIWSIQDRIALDVEEEKALELKRELVAGQERVVWNPAFSLKAKEFEFTAAEAARIRAAVESAFGQSIRRGLPWPRPARSLQFNAGRKIEENGRGHK